MMRHPLVEPLRAAVTCLERADYPRDAICTHHGVGLVAGPLDVTLCEAPAMGLLGGRLAVVIDDRRTRMLAEIRGLAVDWREELRGATAARHALRRRIVARALATDVIEHWNGGAGCMTQSLVLARRCPESLRHCIANYRALSDPFRLSDAERARFAAWTAWLQPIWSAA